MATIDDVYSLLHTVQGNVLYDQSLNVYQDTLLPGIAANAYGAYLYEYTFTYPSIQALNSNLVMLISKQNEDLLLLVKTLGSPYVPNFVGIGGVLAGIETKIGEGIPNLAQSILAAGAQIAALDTYNTTALIAEMNTVMNRLYDGLTKPSGFDEVLTTDIGESKGSDAVLRALKSMAMFGLDERSLRILGQSAGAVAWVESKLPSLIPDFVRGAEGVLSVVHQPAVAFADAIVKGVHKHLSENAPATPGQARQRALNALSQQIGLGIDAHLIALAVESVPYLKHIGFPQLAAFLVDGAGFRRVSEAVVGSFLDAGVSVPGRYDALSTLTPIIPPPALLAELLHRGGLSLDGYSKNLLVAGFSDDWREKMEQAVWQPPSLRGLALTLDDVNIDPAWLLATLQRQGLRGDDADRLQRALIQRTTKSARGRLISAATTGLKNGYLEPSEADQYLESAGLRPDARTIEITAAQLAGRLDLINDTAAVFVGECTDGLIDVDELTTLLTSIGVQPSRLQGMVLKVQGKRGAKHLQEETTAAVAAVREAQRYLIPLYRDLFRSGVLPPSGLLNALEAIGLRPELAASIVSLEQQRIVVGALERGQRDLAATQARILADHKKILDAQVNSGLITIDQYQAGLTTLGIPQEEAATLTMEARVRLQAAGEVKIELSAEANARAVQGEQRRLLTDLYRSGLIADGALMAGLVAAGISTELSGLIVKRERLARDLNAQP
jgi:hypothetical protein